MTTGGLLDVGINYSGAVHWVHWLQVRVLRRLVLSAVQRADRGLGVDLVVGRIPRLGVHVRIASVLALGGLLIQRALRRDEGQGEVIERAL